jgi:hypothetical protein
MKIGFCADLHIGNHRKFGGPVIAGINQRCQLALDVLERAISEACKQCDKLVICGDLFDSATPEPQVLTAAMHRINEAGRSLDVHLLVGNHEQISELPEDHCLGPLTYIAEVVYVQERADFLYLSSYKKKPPIEWLRYAIAGSSCVAAHFGIYDATFPEYLKTSSALCIDDAWEILQVTDVRWLFCGDYHRPAIWERNDKAIVQCGALCPTGFDNPGHDYGRLWILNTNTGDIQQMRIPGPRFLICDLSGDKENRIAELEKTVKNCKALGNIPFVRVNCAQSDIQTLTALLEGTSHEFEIDSTEAKLSTRKAAGAARSATTLLEALEAYIEQMPLAEGIDRKKVFELSKGYLKL